jgi:hypothetical protein
MAAGSQYAPHFPKSGNIVVQMLHYIQSGNQVKRAILERQLLRFAVAHVLKSALLAEFQGIRRNVHAFGTAELTEQLEIRSCPAADIENPRRFAAQLLDNMLQKACQDSTPAGEPPV